MSKFLVINGDDFGLSLEVNQGIILAHQQGILTSASLMVAEDYCDYAVEKAKENPLLGVGLHLVLVSGKSVLSPHLIPHLVDQNGYFLNDPVKAGLLYQFHPQAKQELTLEIKAQLDKFKATGLSLSHIDGHLHLHVHPVILNILGELSTEYTIPFIRLPYEELSFSLKLSASDWMTKVIYTQVFSALRQYGIKILKRSEINYLSRVYGLLATGQLSEDYLLGLIPQIKEYKVEIYGHPALNTTGEVDLQGLLSSQVRNCLLTHGFTLVNYHKIT
ncbi:MAG: hopanoid biosynthesis-associated protein HpnK [Microcystaceae cyanobacterium]